MYRSSGDARQVTSVNNVGAVLVLLAMAGGVGLGLLNASQPSPLPDLPFSLASALLLSSVLTLMGSKLANVAATPQTFILHALFGLVQGACAGSLAAYQSFQVSYAITGAVIGFFQGLVLASTYGGFSRSPGRLGARSMKRLAMVAAGSAVLAFVLARDRSGALEPDKALVTAAVFTLLGSLYAGSTDQVVFEGDYGEEEGAYDHG